MHVLSPATRAAARESHRYMKIRVYKLRLRLGILNYYVIENTFIGAINIGIK